MQALSRGLTQLKSYEATDLDVLAQLRDHRLDELVDRHSRLLDVSLVQETNLCEVFLELAFRDLVDHVVRLSAFPRLGTEDLSLPFGLFGRNLLGIQIARVGG